MPLTIYPFAAFLHPTTPFFSFFFVFFLSPGGVVILKRSAKHGASTMTTGGIPLRAMMI